MFFLYKSNQIDMEDSKTKTRELIDLDIKNLSTIKPDVESIKQKSLNTVKAVGTVGTFSFLNLDKKTVLRVFLILFLLSVLGFNILTHIDEVGNTVGEFVRPITNFLLYLTGETVESTAEVAAKGTKAGIDIAAGTATSGVDLVEDSVKIATGAAKGGIQDMHNTIDSAKPVNIRNRVDKRSVSFQDDSKDDERVMPDNSNSEIQSTNKAGYCYVGKDNGVRSCIKVNRNDVCMSGDIFPSRDICINPNLRE